ncbi:MAG: calcium/sodium antiporter, partial [Clostridia bacterium]|nr:calcium/sodium antiporter [Clostridia bacterium]
MQIFWAVLLLLVGFVMLVKGADWFVDGAAGIAGKLRVPELIVGLTIVAFGTSAPELAVSVSSVLKGSVGLTIGNVIGSNILNILLILGLAAVFTALPVHKNLRKVDFPFLLFVSLLFVLFGAFDNTINRWEGVVLVCLLIAYTAFLIFFALRKRKIKEEGGMSEKNEEEEEEPQGKIKAWYARMKEKTWFLIGITVVGLVLVIEGANIAVDAATTIATALGVSERIIGLTVVAIGTSLPELVTSVSAAIKGKTDIAVGNIVGSNIFNILMVAGVSAIVAPLAFEAKFVIDACIALGAAILLAALGYLPKHKITRIGGIIMLTAVAG